jgi:hypothetical protein
MSVLFWNLPAEQVLELSRRFENPKVPEQN